MLCSLVYELFGANVLSPTSPIIPCTYTWLTAAIAHDETSEQSLNVASVADIGVPNERIIAIKKFVTQNNLS